MNRNVKIAKQLVRIAKELVAESDVKTLQEVIDNKGQVPKETLEDAKDIIEEVMKDPEAQEMLKKMQENTPEGKEIRREVEHSAFVDAHVAATGIGKKLMLLALLALITVPQFASAAQKVNKATGQSSPSTVKVQVQKGGAGKQQGGGGAGGGGSAKTQTASKPINLEGDVTPEDVLKAVKDQGGHPVVGHGENGETYIGVAEILSKTLPEIEAKKMCNEFLQDQAEMQAKNLDGNGVSPTGVHEFDFDNGVGYRVYVLGK